MPEDGPLLLRALLGDAATGVERERAASFSRRAVSFSGEAAFGAASAEEDAAGASSVALGPGEAPSLMVNPAPLRCLAAAAPPRADPPPMMRACTRE